jgi:pimeloyl-ACP methyl ester carboxylesterase
MPFVKADDLNVYYIERGTGTPVVLVHGNWVTSTEWEPVLDRLPGAPSGPWHGIAYDLRGRGQTDGPDSDYTMPELAADLRSFVDALGLDRFHLVGHSLGSAIAMQFALDSPDRLHSLTTLSPGWVDGMPEAYNIPAAQQMVTDDKALYAQALKAQAPTVPDDAFWQRLLAEGHQQRITATLRNLPALLAWQPGDRLGAIGVPTLVVDGALDVLTGGTNAERAAAALHARHVVMPGVGHSPNMEAPDAFVALLVEHWSAT